MGEVARIASLMQVWAWRWGNANPDVDKVLASKGIMLYTRDMMADDQVKACVQIKKLGVVIGGWAVQPAVGEGEDGYEEALEIADFVERQLLEMQGSVESILMNIAHAIVGGFSVQEVNWRYIERGPDAGKIGIASIKPKPVSTITFDMDEFGNVNSLLQTIDTSRETPVPLEKVLLYTYDPQATGLPQGVSDLRAAYRHYWRKEAMLRWSAVAAEKFAAPTPLGKYDRSLPKKQQDDLLKALQSFHTDTAIIVPNTVEVELLTPKTGSVMAPYDSSIEACNKGIAKAIFGQTLATDEGTDGAGSYAQAKIHRGILGMFLDSLRKEIAEQVLKEQLVKRLVNYNFATDLYPDIVLAPPDERDLAALAEIMDKMLTQGVIHKSEPWIREDLGMPPMPEEIARAIEEEEAKAEEEKAAQLEALKNGRDGGSGKQPEDEV
jgi:phage gp29-like protein